LELRSVQFQSQIEHQIEQKNVSLSNEEEEEKMLAAAADRNSACIFHVGIFSRLVTVFISLKKSKW
jgi:hypothetical protein